MTCSHSTFANGLVHPVGQALGPTVRANYNAYVKSGDMTGSVATAYLSLVPFQEDNRPACPFCWEEPPPPQVL